MTRGDQERNYRAPSKEARLFGHMLPKDFDLYLRLDREAVDCSTFQVISTAALLIRGAAEQELRSGTVSHERKKGLVDLLYAIERLHKEPPIGPRQLLAYPGWKAHGTDT